MKILFAAPDNFHRELRGNLLKVQGHDVVWHTDAESTLATLQQAADAGEPFDRVLLEYKLGEESGVDLAREIRKADAVTPIILLSSESSREDSPRKILDSIKATHPDFDALAITYAPQDLTSTHFRKMVNGPLQSTGPRF